MPTEEQLIREYALAWNELDADRVISHLSAQAVYESQNVMMPLRGREAIAEYLRGKMATIRATPEAAVRAELGLCGDQRGARIRLVSAWPGRPCVLLHQGRTNEPVALVLLEVAKGEIDRIDLCTVVPSPASAVRTGHFPRLSDGATEANLSGL
ncbi:MAG TPA: nuclear transport factor 2 family protein [Gemmatimonadales bacterium]|nr:nuclear transport factor 2 family protein [Gemmatimonadales bacterium]